MAGRAADRQGHRFVPYVVQDLERRHPPRQLPPAGAMISLTVALEGVCNLWPQNGKPRAVPVVDFVTGMHTNVLQKGELLRSIFLPASALTKRFAMPQVSPTHFGRAAALIIATVAYRDYDFLLTISAAAPRPVHL